MDATGLVELGYRLLARGDLAGAERQYREALACCPGFRPASNGLLLLRAYFDDPPPETESLLRGALEIEPSNVRVRNVLSWLLLRRGDWAAGWAEAGRAAGHLGVTPRPRWDGSPLGGRTIVLLGEDCFGDQLQFCRYAALVAARGGRVVLECREELAQLLETAPGVSEVVARGRELPDHDAWAPLLSLPGIFGTTGETIPAHVPYLAPDPSLVRTWAPAVRGDGLRVGVAWSADQAHTTGRPRSMPLATLAPLARVPGVSLYSLQVGAAAEAADALAGLLPLTRLDPWLASFSDTAAAMVNLDLVITIDSAPAHLAGALGVPTWVLLPEPACWRWAPAKEASPWYPDVMRLFRQERMGDWAPVIARVADELAVLAGERAKSRIFGIGTLGMGDSRVLTGGLGVA
jgi:hypothetical protein